MTDHKAAAEQLLAKERPAQWDMQQARIHAQLATADGIAALHLALEEIRDRLPAHPEAAIERVRALLPRSEPDGPGSAWAIPSTEIRDALDDAPQETAVAEPERPDDDYPPLPTAVDAAIEEMLRDAGEQLRAQRAAQRRAELEPVMAALAELRDMLRHLSAQPTPDEKLHEQYVAELRNMPDALWTPAAVADRLMRVRDGAMHRLRQERDLAVAHDRQPYPTRWAYEQACRALGEQRRRADQAEELLNAAHQCSNDAEAARAAAVARAEQAEAEIQRLVRESPWLRARDEDRQAAEAAVERVRQTCQPIQDRQGLAGVINASQILDLLSPTWPDGNYEASPTTDTSDHDGRYS